MGDSAGPGVGHEGVVVDIKGAIFMADGGDEAGAGRTPASASRTAFGWGIPVVAPYRFPIPRSPFPFNRVIGRDGAEGVGAAVGGPLGAL